MGQKVHPEGFRLGVQRKGEKVDFKSNWYSDRDYAELLGEDIKIRDHIEKKLNRAGIADIQIRKAAEQGEIAVDIHTARPGIVIGKGGSEVDALRGDLEKLTGKKVQVNVREVSRPELNASLVAESIAEQLVGRAAFRRTMKRALTSAIRSGAEGARIQLGGRLGGIEMSRSETVSEGQDPDGTDRGQGLDQPRRARRAAGSDQAVDDACTQKAQVQETPQGQDAGQGQGRYRRAVRRVRAAGPGACLDH
jgi:small subunit ribosomal protein S3